MNSPIVFEPLYMERVWGGRRLETLFGKHLPNGQRIGESWEIVDREEAQSVVHEGSLRGKTLHELWTDMREEVFGKTAPNTPRFPLLFKLLDAQEKLSVQVHPPAKVAPSLNGEPKTEMWFIASATEDADIYAGLKKDATRDGFERALLNGTVADQLHRIPVKSGDAIFIPSGRVHAIGGGNVIVEVQQNSDTTYRVFDWNRTGLDGKVRALHIEESMASIDFDDAEPTLAPRKGELVVECPYFRVEKWELTADRQACENGTFAIFTVLKGAVRCAGLELKPGNFFLVPASLENRTLTASEAGTTLLRATIP